MNNNFVIVLCAFSRAKRQREGQRLSEKNNIDKNEINQNQMMCTDCKMASSILFRLILRANDNVSSRSTRP